MVSADVPAPVPSDHDLVRRGAAGDERAFEELVRRHQDRVIGICRRLLGDPEEARDGAQEVFLRVYRKAGSFRPRAQVSTWLYRIAVNHCLNRLRRRKVVRFLSLGSVGSGVDGPNGEPDPPGPSEPRGPAALSLTDRGPAPDEALEARRRWATTRRAIDRLPASQRAVVVLARFEGLSYDEIAEVLEISAGAVASRLFRAMRQLEKALEPGER